MAISLLIYNVLLSLALISLAPAWLIYLTCVPKTRAGFWRKLGFYPAGLIEKRVRNERPRIWFHAVSVGEFNAIRPLIVDLASDYEIVISTTTLTGQDLANRTFPQHQVVYFPFDLRAAIHRVVSLLEPDLVVIAETELWPNFTDIVLRNFKIPLIFINGRLSARSLRGYKWIRLLIAPTLRQVTHWYMQSQADADRIRRLAKIAPERITVAGNLKFDLIPAIDATLRSRLATILNISPTDTVMVFASTHVGEDEPLIDAYLMLKKDFPELKVILAPRHPERVASIRSPLNARAIHYAIRSQLSEEDPNRQPLVILDTIGELLTIYSLCKIAVMGGSFVEKGGQNPLEALSQRVPVIFGPHMENFGEITRMILEAEAGSQVSNTQELMHAVTALLTQPEEYDTIAEKGLQLIENNRGTRQMLQTEINWLLKDRDTKSVH